MLSLTMTVVCTDVSADKRHPGFRPFKPVFCKITDKSGDRWIFVLWENKDDKKWWVRAKKV